MHTLTLKVERPGYGGSFIGRHEGKVVMIQGAVLPGEMVELTVLEDKRDYLTASVKRVIERSPDRIEPACKYFGVCGGCHFQHITHDLQIPIKEAILRDCLVRIAKIDVDLSPPLISPSPWYYRPRAQLKAAGNGIGFHMRNTRDIVNIHSCLLMKKAINVFIRNAHAALKDFSMREIHVTAGDCLIAQVITRKGDLPDVPSADRLASALMRAGLSGLIIRRGDDEPLYYGSTSTALRLAGMTYTVSPATFIQNNPELNSTLLEIIKDSLRPLGNKKVLDLYAGAGNFSLPLADEADVTAVEENSSAIEDGIRNMEINKIHGCRFVRSSAEKFRPREKFNAIILDPPRSGVTNRVIKRVLEAEPGQIMYLSCNPSTFARDIKKLSAKYDIESVRTVDFFPQTFHIESLAFLNIR